MTDTTYPTVALPSEAKVVNVGLPLFEQAVRDQGASAVGVEWRIPAGGDAVVVAALARLLGPKAALIDTANAEVVRRLNDGVPMLQGVETAGDVIPGMGDRTVLHCGPAIAWADMPDPLQRSIKAAVIAEGWATNVDGAAALVDGGDVELRPANEHATVVPMATSIGPSAPVYVVNNAAGSKTAFSPINQGAGQVAWFGVDSDEAVDRLRFIRDAVGPVLAEAITSNGPIDAFALASQGVPMGDDVHMRVQATTNLLLRDLLPHLVRSTHAEAGAVATFLSGNHLMFLNVAMAAAKSLVMWAGEVPNSSIVTTMARNGATYGVRLPGNDDSWFLTASPPIQDALYYPGQGPETSAPDIGDSAVLELVGLGGPAAANSPAVAGFLGGRMADAIAATHSMQRICVGESNRFRLPILDHVGTPVGVDVRQVVELGITPAVNTGIIHVSDGSGQVGAGVAHAPMECFVAALLDLDRRIG
ncbi:DUF1116 domain-containing protein [uncultured Ilumatobacter sp.]|jgi:hypothetical protein|uniref:DUF1116 domain-containing protein n=1 Tax=uncultured Ilumatobacter sp. TaxID=879968 RepID=UPI00374FDA0D|tara:strand:- start:124 stop:1548 length:1425 start_codon:yes stop_codon:yes gene_type:complete